jgi:hypothetical protein
MLIISTNGCLTAGYTPIQYGDIGGTKTMTMQFLHVADPWWVPGLGDMRKQKMFEAVFKYCESYPYLTNTLILSESNLYTYRCKE